MKPRKKNLFKDINAFWITSVLHTIKEINRIMVMYCQGYAAIASEIFLGNFNLVDILQTDPVA